MGSVFAVLLLALVAAKRIRNWGEMKIFLPIFFLLAIGVKWRYVMQLDNKNYRLSRWCKYFINENMTALLHSLSLGVVFIPTKIGKRLIQTKSKIPVAEFKDEVIKTLLREKLLVENIYDEMKELFAIQNYLVADVPLKMMYLLLVDFCNLRCKYCFEDTPVHNPSSKMMMNTKTSRKAVEFFAKLTTKYGKGKRIIHLYGGEPLLNKDAIIVSIEKVAELKEKYLMPSECEVVMVTNGVLLDKKMAHFLVKNEVSIGISLDGPANLNNIYRVAKNEMDVFYKTAAAYKLLKDLGAKVGISATLTPAVVQDFDRVLDFFINELGIQDGISFNILHFNPSVTVDTAYFEKAAQCLIKGFQSFRKFGIYEERMMRKIKAFVNREVMMADCGVIGNQIVVSPDGRIGVCQDFIKPRTYFDGSIFDDKYDPVISGLFDEWKKRSPLFMEQCFDCEAVAICGGGCPASVELKTGSRWNVDERICSHSKITLQWLIWETFVKIQKAV